MTGNRICDKINPGSKWGDMEKRDVKYFGV